MISAREVHDLHFAVDFRTGVAVWSELLALPRLVGQSPATLRDRREAGYGRQRCLRSFVY